jgi:hypothetical protein
MNIGNKIICLNGPPGCGKDFAARHVCTDLKSAKYPAEVMKMADPLKKAVHALYGLFYEPGYYDDERNTHLKGEEHPLLFGQSPREAYIALSEEYAKPKHGPRFFGELAANRINNSRNSIFIFSDGGFVDEWTPIIWFAEPENVLIIEVHPHGNHKSSFENDSRGYIGDELKKKYPRIHLRKIPNTFGDVDDRQMYIAMCKAAVMKFLGGG